MNLFERVYLNDRARRFIALAAFEWLGPHAICEANRPNLLLCISDDQSYARTGANSDPVVKNR